MDSSQYVVIGAGLAGASTAWHLARQGYEVTVVERDKPASARGSSHGSARIFRYAYPDEFYTRLVQESRSGWDELSRLADRNLITRHGAVDFGTIRQPERLARILQDREIEHELLPAEAARERWPQFSFDTDVLWHPDAGVIDAQESVLAMVRQARRDGARVLDGWPVAAVERTASGLAVTSDDGRQILAQRVVVAAGGWLPHLLRKLSLPLSFLDLMPRLEVRQEQAYHFPYRDPEGAWPTYIHKREGWQSYGLPGGRDAGFTGQKVAQYNGGRAIPSAAQQDGRVDPANRRAVVDYVKKYMPGLIPEPYAETTCLFTNTPTEDFIIDQVDDLTIVSPCSGHGAKFAPVIGRFAADLATGCGTAPDQFRLGARSAR